MSTPKYWHLQVPSTIERWTQIFNNVLDIVGELQLQLLLVFLRLVELAEFLGESLMDIIPHRLEIDSESIVHGCFGLLASQ